MVDFSVGTALLSLVIIAWFEVMIDGVYLAIFDLPKSLLLWLPLSSFVILPAAWLLFLDSGFVILGIAAIIVAQMVLVYGGNRRLITPRQAFGLSAITNAIIFVCSCAFYTLFLQEPLVNCCKPPI
jgi:hypothetical protein